MKLSRECLSHLFRLIAVPTLGLLLAACSGGSSDYTVTATAGSGGSISPASVTVDEGSTTEFTLTPDSGYEIDGAAGCGGSLSGNTYTTGTITEDCSVSASFSLNSYTISATAGTGGSVSPTSSTVEHGATTSITVTPDTGYSIDSVSGCGGSLSGSTYTTGAISADCSVSATFTTLPSVSIASASVVEGNGGTTTLTFTVSLSKQANGDVNVDYATSDGTATTADGDYAAVSGTLTISSATTSNTVSVTVIGDAAAESSEALTLTLSNVSANAVLGTTSANGTILNDDATSTLNDTGITTCSNASTNELSCPQTGYEGQDAEYGRDATANDDSDGLAGFSFTKIDSGGSPLPADATSWDCVLDKVTGLMWEVKQAADSGTLRAANYTYTWYNSDGFTNGGNAGTATGSSCYGGSNCNTESYVTQVNANGGICGYSDWRMPSSNELASLVDSSIASPGPTIDMAFFPNSVGNYFWSSSPDAGYSVNAWNVYFYYGDVNANYKGSSFSVRLVRAGQ